MFAVLPNRIRLTTLLATGFACCASGCHSGAPTGAAANYPATIQGAGSAASKTLPPMPREETALVRLSDRSPTQESITAGQSALGAWVSLPRESSDSGANTNESKGAQVGIDPLPRPPGSPPSYRLKSPEGREQAIITLAGNGDGVRLDGVFPEINRNYEANHRAMTIEDVVASYVKNGVLVEGKVQLEGLERYCAQRHIRLMNTREMGVQLSEQEDQDHPRPSGARSNQSHGATAPASSLRLSIAVRSDCTRNVRLFFGEKPKCGSGRYGSISPNSVQSETFQPGGHMWIVDDRDNGVAGVQVTALTQEVRVSANCRSIAAR